MSHQKGEDTVLKAHKFLNKKMSKKINLHASKVVN
jgi:hypothetical protein